MIEVMQTLDVLGKKVADKVTGLKGVATSVSFDLYGCVQVLVNPGVGTDGKLGDVYWFDMSRLEISDQRVMLPPKFSLDKGPEAKPTMH